METRGSTQNFGANLVSVAWPAKHFLKTIVKQLVMDFEVRTWTFYHGPSTKDMHLEMR